MEKKYRKLKFAKDKNQRLYLFDFIKKKAIKYSLKSINFSVLFYLSEE
jgi:hypothetical protein